MSGEISGSIFGAGGGKPGQLTQVPYLVTVQFQFKIDARTKEGAELSIMKGISFVSLLSPQLVSMGYDAQPLTEEMLKSMGIDLTRKS